MFIIFDISQMRISQNVNNLTMRNFRYGKRKISVDYHFCSSVPLTLFGMGLFGAAHGLWGQKGPPSLKSVTHILQ